MKMRLVIGTGPSLLLRRQRRTAAAAVLLLGLAGLANATTFTVTATADTNGPGCAATCSLREAINAANNNPGADEIHFNIPGSGVRVMTPTAPYPSLIGPTVIDGYTQTGSAANTLPVGSNAVLLIRIDGSNLSFSPALTLSGGQSVVRGISIGNAFSGIRVSDTPGNTGNAIEGVWIGLTADGSAVTSSGAAIAVLGSTNTSGMRVGGTLPQQRNVLRGGFVIATPVPAIDISANGAVVVNNYFDTDKNGTLDLSNQPSGVIPLRAGTRFGGPTSSERNLVIKGISVGADSGTGVVIEGNYFGLGADGQTAMSGPGETFIDLLGGSAHVVRGNVFGAAPGQSAIKNDASPVPDVQIVGNWMGLAADGVTPRPLGTAIQLGAGAEGTIIGGTGDGDGNLIARNNGVGINIEGALGAPIQVLGNSIGLDALGQPAGNGSHGIRIANSNGVLIGTLTPGSANEVSANAGSGIAVISGTANRISGNSVHDNIGVEIDLGNGTIADGANVNDNLDVDAGGNTRLNHPTITTATRAGVQITANIGFNTAANQSGLSIDIFRSPNCDNTGGLGQARRMQHRISGISSNGSGNVVASIPFGDPDLTPAFYSAILTDASGNTSEITPCVAVPLGLLFLDGFE